MWREHCMSCQGCEGVAVYTYDPSLRSSCTVCAWPSIMVWGVHTSFLRVYMPDGWTGVHRHVNITSHTRCGPGSEELLVRHGFARSGIQPLFWSSAVQGDGAVRAGYHEGRVWVIVLIQPAGGAPRFGSMSLVGRRAGLVCVGPGGVGPGVAIRVYT
jgi:hypothetical protein